MEQTWRWFGPDDVVRLADARQAGATGIVTALHQIPYGVVWSTDEIERRKALIEGDTLAWPALERGREPAGGRADQARRRRSRSRSSTITASRCATSPPAASTTVCYNFMPVLDWTRTELHVRAAGRRPGAALRRARVRRLRLLHAGAPRRRGRSPAGGRRPGARLVRPRVGERQASSSSPTIMAGLPGAFDRYDIPGLRRMLERYRGMTRARLRDNLARFLREVIPTAEEVGIRMCIHPDDPPRPTFGLPRIVGDADDLAFIVGACESPANGITLLHGLARCRGRTTTCRRWRSRSRPKVHFAHLRNVAKEPDGSFMEADHLGGDVDMVAVVDDPPGGAGPTARCRRPALAHPVPARPRPRAARRHRQGGLPGLLGDRPAEGPGRDPRRDDGRGQPAWAAGLSTSPMHLCEIQGVQRLLGGA